MIKEFQCIINVDPAPTAHRSSSYFISGSDETYVGYIYIYIYIYSSLPNKDTPKIKEGANPGRQTT